MLQQIYNFLRQSSGSNSYNRDNVLERGRNCMTRKARIIGNVFGKVFLVLGFGLFTMNKLQAGWINESPEGLSPYGYWTSLALDSNNSPHMAYRNGSSGGSLRYVRMVEGNWSGEFIESGLDLNGGHPSLAISVLDSPNVAYYKTGFGLRYASRDDASWTLRTIDPLGGQYNSLKLDSSGNAHISYFASNSLKYANFDGVTWTTSTVDSGGVVGLWTSLALNSEGKPSISYYDSSNKDLKFAEWNGTSWSIQTVLNTGDSGKYTSLAFDGSDRPSISFLQDLKVTLAEWTGSTWNFETVATDGYGLTSLVLDELGNPSIAYDGSRLKFVSRVGTIWSSKTVDSSQGKYASLARGNDGLFHVSYGSTYFKYAKTLPFSAPTQVSAVNSTSDSIQWQWLDESTIETGYRVLQVNGLNSLSGDLPPNTTWWVQEGMGGNESSKVLVQAVNGDQTINSVQSATVYTLAHPPTNTAIAASSGTNVDMSWSANNNSPSTVYRVDKSEDGISFSEVFVGTTTGTSLTLSEDTINYFRVRSQNSIGILTSYDTVISTSLNLQGPASAGTPFSFARSTESISWAWTDNSNKEFGFRVLRASDLSPLSGDLPANTTQWIQTGIAPNTPSQIVVQAFNTGGENNSNASLLRYSLAVAPSNTTVVTSSGTAISLSWVGNRNPTGTFYELEKSANGISFVTISSGTNTGTLVSSLADVTTHYFRVRAINGDLTPTAYDTIVSTYLPIATPPPPPTNLRVQSRTTDALYWVWAHDSPKETGFRILRSSDSYVLATLPANTTYWAQTGLGINVQSQIQVEAYNSFGSFRTRNSYYSWEEYTSANPPIGTYISSVTATTISVSWDFNGNPEKTYYTAYISSDGVTYKKFDDFNRKSTSRETGLESEKTYYLRITANNGGHDETLPDVIVSTRTPLGPPGMANPIGKESYYGYILWSWENQPNALGYRIYARGGNQLAELSAGQNTWGQIGLGTYESSVIQVESYNVYGSSWSSFGSATTLANPPMDLSVTRSGRTFATLNWSNNNNPAHVYYRIEKSTTSAFPRYIDFENYDYVWNGSTSTTINGLIPGTTYYFRAYAGNNYDTYSSIVSVYTSTGMDAPTSPSATSNSIVWRWNDDLEGETGYRIRHSTTEADLSAILPATQLSWTQTGLQPNTPYQVFLQAEGSFGVSVSPPTQVTFTRPKAPKNVRLVALGSDKISLAWESNGNPAGTHYRVLNEYLGNENDPYLETLADVEGTSITLKGLTSQRTYRLVVIANGPGGDSDIEGGPANTSLVVTTGPKPERFFTSDPTLIIETVDTGEESGGYSSISIENEKPTIYYASGASGDLKKASLSGAHWDLRTIVSNARISSRISSISDANGETVVAFSNARKGLLNVGYVFGNESYFNELPMDSFSSNGNTISFNGQGFQGNSLALNSDKRPVVVYSSNYPASGNSSGVYLFYEAPYNDNTGEWDKSLVATKVLKKLGGQSSSGVGDIQLAIDSNDVSHVVLFHCDDQEIFPTAVGDILYAKKQGDQWVTELIEKNVATEITAIDIELDLQGRPHVVYSDPVHNLVRHAVKDASGWSIENIDENKSVGFVAFAMDGSGNPHVVYTDIEAGDIYYAHPTNGKWDHQMVDGGATGETGWHPTVVIDSYNDVHMAYQDLAQQSLKYATLSNNPTEVKSFVFKEGGRFEFEGSRGPIKIDVPNGAFNQDVLMTLRSPSLFPVSSSVKSNLTPLGFGLEIMTTPSESPVLPISVTLTYGDDMLAGHSESHLVLAYYDQLKGEWIAVPTKVDSASNQLTATITDITLLQVMYNADLPSTDEIIAYPNPMRPNLPGHDSMTFKPLPEGSKITIYTLRGLRVRELDEQGNQVIWNGRNGNGEPVASGVYFVRIVGDGGDKILKVAVQR
jgi:hypothetical protein